MEQRRISTPVHPQASKPKIAPYRSLRAEKNGRNLQVPKFEDIPEDEGAESPVEKRSIKSDRSSRPSSGSDSLKKVRLEVEEKNKKNALNTISFNVDKKTKVRVFERSQSVRSNMSDASMVRFKNGQDNPGFKGSDTHIDMSQYSNSTASLPGYKEQYWSWPFKCSCRSWTRREKILVSVVTVLMLIVCSLVGTIGYLAERRDETKAASSTRAWYTWKL